MIGDLYRRMLWNDIKSNELLIKVLDVGAAGDSAPLWKHGLNSTKFITVDPFAPEGSVDIPYGLGAHETSATLYQTSNPFCSSLFQPNVNYLEKKYNNMHIDQRRVSSKNEIKIVPGDNYIDSLMNLDFIKIDTQGSEHSILLGLKETIERYKPIMYLETWLEEVYKNAPNTHQIINELKEMNYEIIYTEVGASWVVNKTNPIKKGRRQSVGMDILAMHKDTFKNLSIENSKLMLSKVAILELYGMHSHVEKYLNTLISIGCNISTRYRNKYLKRLRIIPNNWLANILDYFCGNRFAHKRIYPKLYD